MRKTKEELQEIMKQKNVSRLWSWSKFNCFCTSPYEYYLKYIIHAKEDNDNCSYATLGGICHSIIERFYGNAITYEKMIHEFEDGWLTAIDIADLKFDRNDETKNQNISQKYKLDLQHFFRHHKKIEKKIVLEQFITADIEGNIFQGYIDAVYKDNEGNYNIIDWKTSTKYSGKSAEEKAGQLIVYAIGLNQKGVPIDKIRIGWNFLKYVSVQCTQVNGTVKTREIERSKIGESLKISVKTWLKKLGYEKNIGEYLTMLLETNDISCLPEEVQQKYVFSDCYVFVQLTQKLIDKWVTTITNTISDIEYREKTYYELKDNDTDEQSYCKIFWDSDESVKSQSYYFSTLCGYSANLHKPYKSYLDKLDASKKGEDMFGNLGKNSCQNTEAVDTTIDSVDLSWMDSIQF